MIRRPKLEYPKCPSCRTKYVEIQGFKNWMTFPICPNYDCPKDSRFKEQLFGESMSSLLHLEGNVNDV